MTSRSCHCKGCGCELILPPSQISCNCVYCGAPHVVNRDSQEQLLAPDGIIPHAFDQGRAVDLLQRWLQDQQTRPEKPLDSPRGVYLPLWTFDLGGEIDYVGETIDQEDLQFGRKHPRMVRVTGSYPVQVNDMPIPASRKLSAVFLRLISTFELKGVKPFDPRYLASWPAEVYDIPLAEASLDARARSLSHYTSSSTRSPGSPR